MGHTGMGEMGTMRMPVPKNSIPMRGGEGPFGPIDMGGMFTVLKVREGLANYDDPGWYRHPPGTIADVAESDALRRDGIHVSPPRRAPSAEDTTGSNATPGRCSFCLCTHLGKHPCLFLP